MTLNTLKNKDLNLLSDCYVEYGRAVSMYTKEECYINEALKFYKLTLNEKDISEWKTKLDEIIRSYIQGWEKSKRILNGCILSFVLKFSD